mgnify:CR=1
MAMASIDRMRCIDRSNFSTFRLMTALCYDNYSARQGQKNDGSANKLHNPLALFFHTEY